MAVSIVKLGSPRKEKGLRIGTVRRPPRGVRKEDFAKLNYYDVWFPTLSPSAELMKLGLAVSNEKEWRRFEKGFLAEMREPQATHALALLAALSHQTDFSIGCYCEDENRCHRSLLRRLLIEHGAHMARTFHRKFSG